MKNREAMEWLIMKLSRSWRILAELCEARCSSKEFAKTQWRLVEYGRAWWSSMVLDWCRRRWLRRRNDFTCNPQLRDSFEVRQRIHHLHDVFSPLCWRITNVIFAYLLYDYTTITTKLFSYHMWLKFAACETYVPIPW